MTSRSIVITGASDGIGAAAARAFAAAGDAVTIVGRSPEKTKRLADELGVASHVTDFAELAQVRALAEALRGSRIDVLVNNAGAIMPGFARTVDGHERTLQVNHLAPFLLTNLLLDTLAASTATVVTTASDAASFGKVDLADLDGEKGFDGKQAYGTSKLANLLFTRELQTRHGDSGINAAAFHPGLIASNFASDTTSIWRFAYNTPLRHVIMQSPEKGIRTLQWLVDGSPGTTWTPGGFYIKGKLKKPYPQAADANLARGLWDRSAELVGLS